MRVALFGALILLALLQLAGTATAIAQFWTADRTAVLVSLAQLFLTLGALWLAYAQMRFRIMLPIERLTRAMRDLAAGDLKTEIPAAAMSGELGEMARAVEVFKRNAVQLEIDNRERRRAERLLQVERGVLELAASRADLNSILCAICDGIEEQIPGARSCVALLLPDGLRLQVAAAPSLPRACVEELESTAAGPLGGACGTAVYRREPVICGNIAAEATCAVHAQWALAQGLNSCWALPILSGDGEPLGALVVYQQEARRPTAAEFELARRAGHLAAIAVSGRRAEDQLQQAKAEAELGSRTKSEFLANMSHELRTPLNAIIGFAEVLETELHQEQNPISNAGFAGDIVASGRHLLTLINDILDVSKMEAGKVELRERICDVAELLAGCERIVRARAMERRIDLQLQVPVGLPAVLVDDVKFKQIILNLLSNAIKFTSPGGAIQVAARADGARGLIVAVKDTGIGIKPDDLSKIFVPFHQVDNIYARLNPGTGLGLTLSKGMAELHGGKLAIESEFGVGTTASLILPPSRLLTGDMVGGEARSARA